MQQEWSHRRRILSLKRLYDANHYSREMRNKWKIKHWIWVETQILHLKIFLIGSLQLAGPKLEMLPYKIVNNNKSVICLVSIQYYLHTILLWPVYYGYWCCHLNNKKLCILSLHLHNFLWLPFFALFLQKLRRLSRNYSTFIYIYFTLKLGAEKHSSEVSISSTKVCLGRGHLLQWGLWGQSLTLLPYVLWDVALYISLTTSNQ